VNRVLRRWEIRAAWFLYRWRVVGSLMMGMSREILVTGIKVTLNVSVTAGTLVVIGMEMLV